MRKTLSLILVIAIILSLSVPVYAATANRYEALAALYALGLIDSVQNFEGQRYPTRYEALAMLVRLLGKRAEAESWKGDIPFIDVPEGSWARGYVGWAYEKGLTTGFSAGMFSGGVSTGIRDMLTYVLRALGYSDKNGDFSWAESIPFADSVGLTHGEYNNSALILRYDMAIICYTALSLPMKGTEKRLIEKLYEEGAVSYSALVTTRLARFVNVGKQKYTAAEIYQRSSGAVFTVSTFRTIEDKRANVPASTASGFFITADGVAVMSYHGLDNMPYAAVTTNDGHTYDVVSVLDYDTYTDYAVVRVTRADWTGGMVDYFPWIDIGDSDAIGVGDKVYTLSSPIGMSDCMSDGMISTVSRTAEDKDYPYIQNTAPISHGSSGGPLLNEYGEAIGIIYGSFTSGESMYLSVPINVISHINLLNIGSSYDAFHQKLAAQKLASTLSVSETDLVIKEGETVTITVTADYPGNYSVRYRESNLYPLLCRWVGFTSKRTIDLEITGVQPGTCTVTISYEIEDAPAPEATATINVMVIENPDLPDEG